MSLIHNMIKKAPLNTSKVYVFAVDSGGCEIYFPVATGSDIDVKIAKTRLINALYKQAKELSGNA